MTLEEIVEVVKRAGGVLELRDESVRCVLPRSVEHLADELREHKAEIIELLQSRTSAGAEAEHAPVMPVGVRLIHWEPKPAPVRLSPCSTVTDTEKFIRATLAQLAAHLRGEKFVDGGWGLSGLLARLEACGCVVELHDAKRALQ